MTEVSNVKSGGQVITLKSTNARDPVGPGSIDRFKGREGAPVGEAGPTEVTPVRGLDKGEDPLEKAAQAIEEFVNDTGPNTKLRIDRDDDTGRFVYKSIDSDSGEVISQFPPETILQIISKFRDPEGLVVDDEA